MYLWTLSRDIIYEDKSLYKHEAVYGIKGTEGVRALDTNASWSTSKYRGWVYGYGLHLTTTANGFPQFANVYTALVFMHTPQLISSPFCEGA